VGRALSHRGPDDTGLEVLSSGEKNIALVHTRLSIIDLSKSGHQPFRSSDGRWRLIFNGEIYNYLELKKELEKLGAEFSSVSDTEVLLWAWRIWGKQSLGKLRGMFAFIVFDREQNLLTAVRDAFGIKPLFHCKVKSGWAFSSEIDALRILTQHNSGINQQVVYDFLTTGLYDQGSQTFFEGVFSLPPGHLARIDLTESARGIELEQWLVRPSTEEHAVSWEDAKEKVSHKLEESVRLHLRSDVGLGVALSGGLDSSALTALIRKIEPEAAIQTFSFVSPETAADESYWSNAVAKHLGTTQHLVAPTAAEFLRDIDDVVRTQGEPFLSLSVYAQYAIYREARNSGIKVVIDGQGGDEVFAGYQGYPQFRLRSLMSQGDFAGALGLIRDWSLYPNHQPLEAATSLAGTYLGKGARSFLRSVLSTSPMFPWLMEPQLKALAIRTSPEDTYGLPLKKPLSNRELTKRLSQALFSGEMVHLLRHGDRSSMRWSVESRVPFLDLELIRLVQSLPEEYLLSPQGQTKQILRHAIGDLLPPEVRFRKDKVGFEAPDLAWIRTMSRSAPELTEGLERMPWINHQKVNQLLQDVLDGRSSYSNIYWKLINLAKWGRLVP
jgi:asparagine synthase (glutamine-hydrolysing)